MVRRSSVSDSIQLELGPFLLPGGTQQWLVLKCSRRRVVKPVRRVCEREIGGEPIFRYPRITLLPSHQLIKGANYLRPSTPL